MAALPSVYCGICRMELGNTVEHQVYKSKCKEEEITKVICEVCNKILKKPKPKRTFFKSGNYKYPESIVKK